MADARVARLPGAPWTVRLFETVPLAPVWTGLGIAVLWWGIYGLYAFTAGWTGEASFRDDLRFEILWAVMIAYAPTATRYALRAAVRDLEQLRPVLRCTDAEFQDALHGIPRFDRKGLWVTGAASVVNGLLIPFGPGYWVEGRPELGDPAMIWNLARNVVLCWMLWRSLYIEVVTAARFSRMGSRWAEVDLLAPGALTTFGRRGLPSVLLIMGFAVLFSLLFTAPWDTDYITIAALVAFLGVAGTALLLPALGVHRRVRGMKHETLERVDARIRDRGDPLREPGAGAGLADLLAYRDLVESAPTWPFSFTTLLRFGLYVALGLGSWLGAAFVERVLDAALG